MIRGCQESGGAGHCIEVSHAVDPAITLGRIETPEEPKTWGCPLRVAKIAPLRQAMSRGGVS